MPLSVHDIKTTGAYEVGKFKGNAQHLVYPYCLREMGYTGVDLFSYDVAEISTNITKQNPEPSEVVVKLKATYSEEYLFTPERDIPLLEDKVVELIDFIEANRHLITNPKIFAKRMIFNLAEELGRRQFKERCDFLLRQGFLVELTEKRGKRTLKQNSYLHLLLSYFALQYGERMETIKQEVFKRHVNPDIFLQEKDGRGGRAVLRPSLQLRPQHKRDDHSDRPLS